MDRDLKSEGWGIEDCYPEAPTGSKSELSDLLSEFSDIFSDWEGDFIIAGNLIDDDEAASEGLHEYEVSVRHKHLMEKPIWFSCRKTYAGFWEYEYSEECWSDIDKGNIFASMWFDAVDR